MMRLSIFDGVLRVFLTGLACVLSEYAFARPVVLACVDCYSSMSLSHQVFQRLFPQEQVKWILIQSHEYDAAQERLIQAFPKNSRRLKMQPLEEGLSEKEVLEICKKARVEHFVGGMDKGSFAASKLNAKADLRNNNPELADVRLHKDRSAKVSGEYAIPTHSLVDVESARRWVKAQPQDEFIIKPDVGVLGRDTFFLSKDDLLKSPEKLQSLLLTNERFLIQPRIRGRLFYANTYSTNGKHIVTAASEYFQIQRNDKPIYFLNGHLDLQSAEVQAMRKAIEVLLPAHGITFGPSHPEFIIEEGSHRLYLLEMNGRVAGLGTPEFDRMVYGISQLDLHFMALLDDSRFWPAFNSFPRPREKYGFMYVVASAFDGSWNSQALAQIKKHPSYFSPSRSFAIDPARPVKATLGMNDIAGVLYFLHSEINQVREGVDLSQKLFDSGNLLTESASSHSCVGLFNDEDQYLHLRDEQRKARDRINWDSW